VSESNDEKIERLQKQLREAKYQKLLETQRLSSELNKSRQKNARNQDIFWLLFWPVPGLILVGLGFSVSGDPEIFEP
jgi:hypothetical protein